MPKNAKSGAVEVRKKEFLERVRRLLKSDKRVKSVEPHATEFAFVVGLKSGEGPILFLDNFFAESADIDPDERDDFLRSRFQPLLSPSEGEDESWAKVAPNLVPTIRSSAFGLSMMLLEKDAKASFVRKSFAPFLDLYLAIDSETSIRYALESNLEDWEVTEKKAFDRALENAKRLAPPKLYDKKQGPLWFVDANDTYESSRLAIPGFLASFEGRVDGRPIAIVPERAQLYVAGDAKDKMVARLLEMAAREYEASTRAVSPAIYTVDDAGKVVPYRRKKRDKLAHEVMLGHVKLALREYAEQKEVLDKVHERDEIDLFVASLNGIRRDDGRAITWCMWGEGIDSLLPVAELVMLAADKEGDKKKDEEGDNFFVPWAIVEETMGKAWRTEVGHDPVRIHPPNWPSKAQSKRLRAAAVELSDVE